MKFFSEIRSKILWILFFIIIVIILFANGGIRHYREKRYELKNLNRQTVSLERELKNKKSLLKLSKTDDTFLEMMARRELGLMRQEEIEFRFLPSKDSESNAFEDSRNGRVAE